jgi:hypothetical protein
MLINPLSVQEEINYETRERRENGREDYFVGRRAPGTGHKLFKAG